MSQLIWMYSYVPIKFAKPVVVLACSWWLLCSPVCLRAGAPGALRSPSPSGMPEQELDISWPHLSDAGFKDPEKNPFIRAATRLNTPHKGPPITEEWFITGATPLHKAAAMLLSDKVDEILASGKADIDAKDNLDQTPLVLLARHHYTPEDVPKAVEMIKKIISAGATLVTEEGVIRRDQYGDSVLHLAAMGACKNGPAILQTLVDALPAASKAKLCGSRCKNFGNTALHWAIMAGDKEACQLLVETGMPLDRKNRQKQDIIEYCDVQEKPELKEFLQKIMSKK